MRIPLNQKSSPKYTQGDELIYSSSKKNYKGYYFLYNGVPYAGKDENTYPTLILLEKIS